MKTKIHMQDQVVNKIEAIMLHDQMQRLLAKLMKVIPRVMLYRVFQATR